MLKLEYEEWVESGALSLLKEVFWILTVIFIY